MLNLYQSKLSSQGSRALRVEAQTTLKLTIDYGSGLPAWTLDRQDCTPQARQLRRSVNATAVREYPPRGS